MEFGDTIRIGRMNSAGLRFFAEHPMVAGPASRDR
jgi:hypothetical protein